MGRLGVTYKNRVKCVTLDGKPIATCVLRDTNEKAVYIAKFEVDEEHRRRGHATFLMESVFAQFSKKESVSLHVEVVNKVAVKFYRRLGFFVSCCTMHKGFDMKGCRKHYMMTKKL